MSLIQFVKDINEIYNNISIYRAVIIAKDEDDAIELKERLKEYDFDPIIIDNSIINLNYRLFIVKAEDIRYLNYLDKKEYNFIGVNYSVNKNIINLIE